LQQIIAIAAYGGNDVVGIMNLKLGKVTCKKPAVGWMAAVK
jgi:hypothetical protein